MKHTIDNKKYQMYICGKEIKTINMTTLPHRCINIIMTVLFVSTLSWFQ